MSNKDLDRIRHRELMFQLEELQRLVKQSCEMLVAAHGDNLMDEVKRLRRDRDERGADPESFIISRHEEIMTELASLKREHAELGTDLEQERRDLVERIKARLPYAAAGMTDHGDHADILILEALEIWLSLSEQSRRGYRQFRRIASDSDMKGMIRAITVAMIKQRSDIAARNSCKEHGAEQEEG
jgi:hypothetical protein